MLACVILHNMIVEERGYEGTAKFRISEDLMQTIPTTFTTQQAPQCPYEQSALWQEELDPIESLDDHHRLLNALMQNMWNAHGDT